MAKMTHAEAEQIRKLLTQLVKEIGMNAVAAVNRARAVIDRCVDDEAGAAIVLPVDLVSSIDAYLDTNWRDGRDPSRIGALNAVAFIGERVVAIYASKRKG